MGATTCNWCPGPSCCLKPKLTFLLAGRMVGVPGSFQEQGAGDSLTRNLSYLPCAENQRGWGLY